MSTSLRTLRMSLAALGLAAAGAAQATTTGFEEFSTGNYSSLIFAGMTITSTRGFDVVDAAPGNPISGHALLDYTYGSGGVFRATFAGGASSFSIGMGDYGADDDQGHLEAYDASGHLLSSDSLYVPQGSYTGGMMTVASSAPIAYVLFYETGSFPGAVYWDQASFTAAVPEPASVAMMLGGLAVLGGLRRRRRAD